MRGRILAAAALAMLVPHTARAALRGQPYVSSHTNFWSPGQPLRNKRALLGRSEELTVTEQVAKLQGWCDVRDDMTLSLGRQPTRDEWAQALGFQSSEEESAVEILEQQLREKRKAKETVVHANLGLVVSVATKYQDRGVPLPDLIQEGCIGLIRGMPILGPKPWKKCRLWLVLPLTHSGSLHFGQPRRNSTRRGAGASARTPRTGSGRRASGPSTARAR